MLFYPVRTNDLKDVDPAAAAQNVKTAEAYFGTTYNINEAGYIFTDGKLLDMSRRRAGASHGGADPDHIFNSRRIGQWSVGALSRKISAVMILGFNALATKK